MSYNGKKVADKVRIQGIKAKDFFAFVYPDRRSGNSSYNDIENNDNPKAEAIERMADMLQCPIDDLFDREKTYPTKTPFNTVIIMEGIENNNPIPIT